jgi:hypothetical protein
VGGWVWGVHTWGPFQDVRVACLRLPGPCALSASSAVVVPILLHAFIPLVPWHGSLSQSVFETGFASFGGAIAMQVRVDAALTGTTFSSNTASATGGAIFREVGPTGTTPLSSFGKLVLTACAFSSNRADAGGAGVFAVDVDTSVTLCTFTSNAVTTTSTNTTVGGAGLYFAPRARSGLQPVEVLGCNFTRNTAMRAAGLYLQVRAARPVVCVCLVPL